MGSSSRNDLVDRALPQSTGSLKGRLRSNSGLHEPYLNSLKGGCIGDYIGDYYRGY